MRDYDNEWVLKGAVREIPENRSIWRSSLSNDGEDGDLIECRSMLKPAIDYCL